MDKLKIIELKSNNSKNINTELLFEIASARAENYEILRISYDRSVEKIEHTIISLLKKMKASSTIQFFATPEFFSQYNTEAVFLLNKYSDIFESQECYNYIYIKI